MSICHNLWPWAMCIALTSTHEHCKWDTSCCSCLAKTSEVSRTAVSNPTFAVSTWMLKTPPLEVAMPSMFSILGTLPRADPARPAPVPPLLLRGLPLFPPTSSSWWVCTHKHTNKITGASSQKHGAFPFKAQNTICFTSKSILTLPHRSSCWSKLRLPSISRCPQRAWPVGSPIPTGVHQPTRELLSTVAWRWIAFVLEVFPGDKKGQ